MPRLSIFSWERDCAKNRFLFSFFVVPDENGEAHRTGFVNRADECAFVHVHFKRFPLGETGRFHAIGHFRTARFDCVEKIDSLEGHIESAEMHCAVFDDRVRSLRRNASLFNVIGQIVHYLSPIWYLHKNNSIGCLFLQYYDKKFCTFVGYFLKRKNVTKPNLVSSCARQRRYRFGTQEKERPPSVKIDDMALELWFLIAWIRSRSFHGRILFASFEHIFERS